MPLTRDCFRAVTFVISVALVITSFSALSHADEPGKLSYEAYHVHSTGGVVAADHRVASMLGAEILARGGNAADASVTAMLALGVVNPFASGLGGGGFCLYRDATDARVHVLDFREVAPIASHRDMYIVDGDARHDLARHGGLAVGVPGEAAGLWALHGRFGRLPWEDVVDPAYRIAYDGFEVGETLSRHLENLSETVARFPELAQLFRGDDENWVRPGDMLRMEALAKTLKLLKSEGVAPFYSGEIAEAIARTAQSTGGIITIDDLKQYRLELREAVHGTYRDYEIISMPPPSSGGVALIQILNILENISLSEMGWDGPAIHYIVEALKHAFADRARWLGDADFVDVPVDRLTSKSYAKELFLRINPDAVLELEDYGTAVPSATSAGTSHLSVMDKDGNMAACTTTINTRFGSMVVVPEYGIILNNEMADFNIQPGAPNVFGLVGSEQNAVHPGKRPLSSMSPTLLLHKGEPFMTIGASGGPTIISSALFAILYIVDFQRTALEAVVDERLHHQWLPNQLRVERTDGLDWIEQLRKRGHEIIQRPAFSSVQMVTRSKDGIITGVSDPRKGGHPKSEDQVLQHSDPEIHE